MKASGVLLPIWLASAVLSSSAPTEIPSAPATETTPAAEDEKPQEIARFIDLLADEDYRTRERATEALWKFGDKAVEELREAAAGPDPEAAHRAMDLIRKIELHITPETDPKVVRLVELYVNAPQNKKPDLFASLRQAEAWRQLLKLFAAETDPALREQLQGNVEGVAMHAARERIMAGDAAGAREFLEMAPADPRSMLALADFHRVDGTWQEELSKAEVSTAKGAAAWRVALHRAAGNIPDALEAAIEAGDTDIAAAMAMITGNPLPGLHLAAAGGDSVSATVAALAIKRWEGKILTPEDFQPLTRLLASPNRITAATNGLFLLGNPQAAEKSLATLDQETAFNYFNSLERTDEALRVFGLDPAEPDYAAWIKEQFEPILEDPTSVDEIGELTTLALFMEARGLHDELAAAFDAPLAELIKVSDDVFPPILEKFLESSYSYSGDGSVLVRISPILDPVLRAGIAWAGEDEDRWLELVTATFSESSTISELWAWLGELDPSSNRIERFYGLLALCEPATKDRENRRGKWLALAWQEIEEAPEDERTPLLERILMLCDDYHEDVATFLRAWDMLPEDERENLYTQKLVERLTAADRWDEAATVALEALEANDDRHGLLAAVEHAGVAGLLRRAGRLEEAAEHDLWVEKLAMGDFATAYYITEAYQGSGDFESAAKWRARAVQWSPFGPELIAALGDYAHDLLKAGEWQAAAATAEINAHLWTNLRVTATNVVGTTVLRTRLMADLPRALTLLEIDRPRAVALLAACHSLFPCDGSLADDFFPTLRRAGLINEHDQFFEITWDMVEHSLSQYPNADNSLNTAGWLAGRAQRKLSQAETFLQKALKISPNQPAYLDTLAEIQFARGDRQQAIHWSKLALNFMPSDALIRQQYERFLTGPLPE